MKRSMVLETIRIGDAPREVGYPTHVYPYTAGFVGGMAGGVAMIVPALAYGLMSGRGIWYPVNLVAATVLRNLQVLTLEQLVSFSPSALMVGLAIHLSMAAILGLVFAILLPTLPGRPLLWALVVGPLLWLGATLVVLPSLNPVMSQWLDWPSFALANIAYGGAMGAWVTQTPLVPADRAHHLRFYRPISKPPS